MGLLMLQPLFVLGGSIVRVAQGTPSLAILSGLYFDCDIAILLEDPREKSECTLGRVPDAGFISAGRQGRQAGLGRATCLNSHLRSSLALTALTLDRRQPFQP